MIEPLARLLRRFLHRRDRVLAAEQHAEHVDVHRLLVGLDRRGHRVVVVAEHHAGVVVQHVQTAERLDGVLHGGLDRLLVGDVAAHVRGLAAGRGDRLDGLVAVGRCRRCTTLAPSAANRSAPTRPSPDDAPVIRATLPARRLMAPQGSRSTRLARHGRAISATPTHELASDDVERPRRRRGPTSTASRPTIVDGAPRRRASPCRRSADARRRSLADAARLAARVGAQALRLLRRCVVAGRGAGDHVAARPLEDRVARRLSTGRVDAGAYRRRVAHRRDGAPRSARSLRVYDVHLAAHGRPDERIAQARRWSCTMIERRRRRTARPSSPATSTPATRSR